MRGCLEKGKAVFSHQQESHAQSPERGWDVWETESSSVWAHVSQSLGRQGHSSQLQSEMVQCRLLSIELGHCKKVRREERAKSFKT